MADIPFSRFDGYLKQINLNKKSIEEKILFRQLFPKFYDISEIDPAISRHNREIAEILHPLIRYEEKVDNARRFAGNPNLSRGRYYSISKDEYGNDSGTLANELKAYRDLKQSGYIKIVDLGTTQDVLPVGKKQALAIIIYAVERVPIAKELIARINKGRNDDRDIQNVLIIEYEYNVHKTQIDGIIDLRVPFVREWFFHKFASETEDGTISYLPGKYSTGLPEDIKKQFADSENFTILSRFRRKKGKAPSPGSFYEMLPTLINPFIGGGTAGDGGAILEAIGTWLRQNEVTGLVYPSARSNFRVEVKDGIVKDFRGWCFVDYRVQKQNVKIYSLVLSPWAWINFLPRVQLTVKKEPQLLGSFSISGIEEFWSQDYGFLGTSIIRATEEMKRERREYLYSASNLPTRMGAWRLGVASIEWLTLNAVMKKPSDGEIEKLVFAGLVGLLDHPSTTSRIYELHLALMSESNLGEILSECTNIVDEIAEKWKEADIQEQVALVLLANRLHCLRLWTEGSILAIKSGITIPNTAGKMIAELIGGFNVEACKLSNTMSQNISDILKLGISLCSEQESFSRHNLLMMSNNWDRRWAELSGSIWKQLQ